MGNLLQNQNSEAQRNYDCDSCGKSSTQLGNLNKHIMGIHAGQRNYKCVSCGKYITFNLKLHNKMYPTSSNSNVKFVEKKLLERKILKCIWKMSIKDFKKYKCDECGKNFTHNIGLKGHITAVHERKD